MQKRPVSIPVLLVLMLFLSAPGAARGKLLECLAPLIAPGR